MRKKLKMLAIFISLFLISNKVYAVDYLKGFYINNDLELNKTEIKGANADIIGNSSAGNTYFKLAQLSDNNEYTIAYCSDGNKQVFVVDDKITMTKNCSEISKNRKSLIYTFLNGYNYSHYNKNYSSTDYLTGEYLKDYYITQTSAWHFTKSAEWMDKFNFTTNTYNGSNTGVITKITKLINDANKAESGANLIIEPGNINFTLTNDEKYYISNPIKIKGTYLNSEISIKIEGAAGAFATADSNGTSGTSSIANNSTVYIKVPNASNLNTNVKITFSATTLINESKIIECNHATNNESQPMIIYVPSVTSLSKSINAIIHKYPVQIIKKDIIENKEIEGANLTITDSNNKVIEKWISDNTAKTIYLEPGKYFIEETIAPDGYIKNSNKTEFTISSVGKILIEEKEVSQIIITNNPILVSISKRSITGSEELKDAKLKITDKNGNIINDVNGNKLEWISTDKPKTFQLKKGNYILSETIAPEGYELSERTIEFQINENGNVLIDGKEVKDNLIIFKNTPEPKQVPTGNTLVYIAISLCLISLVTSIYIIIKRKEL